MIIQHNMAAVNTMTQLGIVNTNLGKATQRLSSGYRVNRAADDAATLAISEKKRAQVRGLQRAAKNAEDGVGFVQTGDGAMGQMEGLLQRMRELTIQSLNEGVYTPADQAAMQMEFDELQSEIDRINDQTEFNKKPVFEHYPNTYSAFLGNRIWSQDQLHQINSSNQSLTVKYQVEDGGPEQEITLTIPEGTYTTQELIDEMDDVVVAMGKSADGMYLEFSDDQTCNMVLRDGVDIKDVTGGLSYLFYDEYGGSKVGSLIGTTIFDPDYALKINDQNNELKFTIEYFDGTSKQVDLLIDEGYYTREDMIDYLNQKLAGTGMQASEYGDFSIQVGGEDGIITGLKGNMFKIDEKGEKIMVSVFYDNTKYGGVSKAPAEFVGGAVLVSRYNDYECNEFEINDTNNTLRIRVGQDPSAPFADVKLDNGTYTMSGMVAQLQNKFNEAGVEAVVDSYGPTRNDKASPNGNWYYFSGLTITSKEKEKGVKIEFDRQGSTAYDTLFVRRTYTDEGRNTKTSQGRDKYVSPTLTGGTIYGKDNIPVTIDKDNCSFVLQVSEQAADGTTSDGRYTIQLTPGPYNSFQDILDEINAQINNGPVGIKDKIQAVNSGGAIQFRAANDNRTVISISFGETSSPGYKALFEGHKTVYSTNPVYSSGYPPKLELDKLKDPMKIDGTNDTLHVSVGSEDRVVNLPHGDNVTSQDIADAITDQLKGKETTKLVDYQGTGTGTTTSNTKEYTGSGSTYHTTTVNCNVTGSGEGKDGNTGVAGGEPAKYTVPVTLPGTTKIDGMNNKFHITVNGSSYDIELDKGDYTPEQLASHFNDKLDSKISSGALKVNVTLKDGRLHFETRGKGSDMSMQFGNASSSFLNELTKRETPASATTKPLQSSISIGSGNNTFMVNVNGTDYSVDLDPNTYDRTSFAKHVEQKLNEKGANVAVSYDGGLKIQTNDRGTGTSVTLNSGNCGSAGTAMFGEQKTKTPASATISPALSSSSGGTTTKNDSAEFVVQLIDGSNTKTVTLSVPSRPGGYTNTQLRDELKKQLENTDIEASVSLVGNNLQFDSTSGGDDVSLDVVGTVSVTSKTPDITASVDPDTGKLVLKGPNGTSISMTPAAGSAVLQPIPHRYEYKPRTPVPGNIDQAVFSLNTNEQIKVPAPVKIEDYNKEFTFAYVSPAGMKNVRIELDEGDYDHERLQRVLQEKLDNELGKGELAVNVADGKIGIKAGHVGDEYSMANLGGGFYRYVLTGMAVRGSNEETGLIDGRQIVKDTYIVGRKDIRNNDSKIQKDINDKLTVDVTINGVVHKLEMTLDPGTYNHDSLIAHIQEKLDEQVKEKGLPEHCILAGVGVFDSGVEGADDKNALFFYLNPDASLEEGDYRIDGLGGTSLFEIFYKTEGDLIPAYMTGTKDITDGLEILPGENKFTVDVDGTTYEYEIPPGQYSVEEFLKIMNEEILENPNAYLTASMSGNALKLSHEKMGEHTINNIQGPAKRVVFYEIDGRANHDSGEWLQIGANEGQGTTLQRFCMSTMGMGINSITISGQKYANKALQRLDDALGYLNSARGQYGAKQNRLEYTIKGNENAAENTQASESRDRDADMAEEAVQYAKLHMLQQSGMAILSQANQQSQHVLSLLQ